MKGCKGEGLPCLKVDEGEGILADLGAKFGRKWVPKWVQNGPVGFNIDPWEFKMLKMELSGFGNPQVRPKEGSRGPSWSQERLQGAQDETKMAPREPQEDPGWTKRSPKGVEREPKRSQRCQKGTKVEAPEVQKMEKFVFQNR